MNMEKIPTAKEIYLNVTGCILIPNSVPDIQKAMIEFAKLHVEAALKAKGKAMQEKSYEDSSYSIGELDAFTSNCYSLENIK